MKRFEQCLALARNTQVNQGGSPDQMLMVDVMTLVNDSLRGSDVFDRDEVLQFLQVLGDDNRVWYREQEELLMFM